MQHGIDRVLETQRIADLVDEPGPRLYCFFGIRYRSQWKSMHT
nr:hypothetical protein [Natrarchaeobius chitinivorans]